jgi:hypothetical protein
MNKETQTQVIISQKVNSIERSKTVKGEKEVSCKKTGECVLSCKVIRKDLTLKVIFE